MADRKGRHRFYLAGIGVFTLGSLAAAFSVNAATLILSRIVQGVGAALLSATSAAIITAAFGAHERGKALGISVMVIYGGLSVGPPLGGFLVDRFSWPWIFLINLPVGFGVLLWGLKLLPKDQPEQTSEAQGSDLGGATLLGLFLLCLVVPLSFSSEWGWHLRTWVPLLFSPVFLALLLWSESKRPDPMLDLVLLRTNRLFAMANLAALLNYMALYAVAILTAAQLQLVQGRSARLTGWVMLSQPFMQSILSPLAGHLSDRMGARNGSRILSTAGMVLTAAGMVGLALLAHSQGLGWMLLALGLVGMGMALFSTPNVAAIMGSVAKDQLGRASAFQATMRVIGQSMSVGVLGGIAASRLGPGGWKQLLHSAPGSAQNSAQAFAWGYSAAMLTGAFLVLLGAWASMTRGER
jgi:MFS family permease